MHITYAFVSLICILASSSCDINLSSQNDVNQKYFLFFFFYIFNYFQLKVGLSLCLSLRWSWGFGYADEEYVRRALEDMVLELGVQWR